MTKHIIRSIYTPRKGRPMSVIVFASGGGNNLKAAIDLAKKEPTLLSIDLVVTDRLGIKAIDIAKENRIPVIAKDFEKECGIWSECKKDLIKIEAYNKCAIDFHNKILDLIIEIEKERNKRFDLVVLSYHRWIHGNLLEYFRDRTINQHSGDLTIMDSKRNFQRKYRGINPVLMALNSGDKRTRTSTFLVNEGHDTGEILCQGAWVTYNGPKTVTKDSAWIHEVIQKEQSDWTSLTFALREISKGNFGIAKNFFHKDGSRVISYKGELLSYGGIDLDNNK